MQLLHDVIIMIT